MSVPFVVLGLAAPRVPWFRTVGHWSASALIPVEFVRCVSIADLRSRLRSDRRFSAALVDGGVPGVDRDLVGEARGVGVPVLVVGERPADRRELGAAATLTTHFSHDELLQVLNAVTRPIEPGTFDPGVVDDGHRPRAGDTGGRVRGEVLPRNRGWLVAVTGPGGTGTSTVAIALAQGFATGPRPAGRVDGVLRRLPAPVRAPRGHRPRTAHAGPSHVPPEGRQVLLADLCRVADQALLHDAQALVPGLQEVTEAHRRGDPDPADVRGQTFAVPERGYRLLLGLRRPHHWSLLKPGAVERTIATLRGLADVVVADVEVDVEGQAESGSIDVEERNVLARVCLRRASAVVVVVEPSMKGLYAAVRTLGDLVGHGVGEERLLVVFNRAPRSPRRRAELASSLQALAADLLGQSASRLASALHVPAVAMDPALRDGAAIPGPLPMRLAAAVDVLLRRVGVSGESAGDDEADRPRPLQPLDLVREEPPDDPGALGG